MLDFKLPEVGENITSGQVVSIMVAVGDNITKDQDLLELETDKASLPVPAPCDGVVKEILIKEGQDVEIGSVIMKIEESENAGDKDEAKQEKPSDVSKESEEKAEPKAEEKSEQDDKPAQQPAKQQAPAPQQGYTPQPNASIPPQGDVPAAPAVRRLARELGIVISQVNGTGPGGRISKDDVKAFAKAIISVGGAQASSGPPKKPLPDFSKWGEVEREKMSKIRQVTAQHLSHCWQTIPHVTQFDKTDITNLEKVRKEHSTLERKLTITPFLLKVMAVALKEFPQFNASVDMDTHEVIYKSYFNLGVAVDTDRGLLVPVIRDIDKKTIFEITDELNEMAERARNKKTGLDELQGGSMTLTNLGGIGGTSFTPIVNWPEVAILGTSRGGFEPVYDKESKTFTPRFKLPLSLSYDHRIIDGADGARFLRFICTTIETTKWENELK